MIPGFAHRRQFKDLTEQEMLALAISSEEDDARIYRHYAHILRANYPASAAVFDGMAEEEDEHRRRLIDLHRDRFGEMIPLIRREHVAGFYARRPVWLVENLSLEAMRGEAAQMEKDAQRFYENAGPRFWWASRPPSGLVSRWGSRKPRQTMVKSRGAGRLINVVLRRGS